MLVVDFARLLQPQDLRNERLLFRIRLLGFQCLMMGLQLAVHQVLGGSACVDIAQHLAQMEEGWMDF